LDNQWNSGNSQDPLKKNEQPADTAAPASGYTGFSPVLEPDIPPRRKHSGLGIASFTLFAVMAVAFVALLAAFFAQISDVINIDNPEEMDPELITEQLEDLPLLAVIGFMMIGTLIGNLIGLVLGIIGLVQKQRKKLFAVLGTILNGLVIGVLLILFVLGLAMAAGA
jgi:hypothetical protein